MGKAAERRKARRQQYLSALAVSNPEKFHEEWNKRIESWLDQIQIRAGRIVDRKGTPIPRAFEVVDSARRILAECGNKASSPMMRDSVETLTHECCRALASEIDPRMYSINLKLEKR